MSTSEPSPKTASGAAEPVVVVEETRCERLLREALANNFVKFARDKMHELGCGTTTEKDFRFACEPCGNKNVIGYFKTEEDGRKGVVICEDNVEEFKISGEHVQRTVLHELIHAYDTCRAKVDSNDCRHLACTEIRAALLSGDCDMFNEWRRRNFSFKGQGMACVKRRAELSVAGNPKCAGEIGKAAIEEVFETCYGDTAPFEQKF